MKPDEHVAMEADRLELAELDFALSCLARDVEEGRAPRWARRGLFPHEIAARTNFAGIADDVNSAALAITTKLGDQRAKFFALLRADLAALGSVDAVVARLQAAQALGINSIPGATDLITASMVQTRPLLENLLATAADRIRAEATAQGVDIATVNALSERAAENLARQARRLAVLPHADGLRAVAERAIEIPSALTVEAALGMIDQAGRSLSEKPLATLAQQAGSSAVGLGRLEAAGSGGVVPQEIYASELLDQNTCDPCYHVDGKTYPSLEAMRIDYPAGIFVECLGGMACRGTPVIVWSTEVQSQTTGGPNAQGAPGVPLR